MELLANPQMLTDRVRRFHPLSREAFYQLKEATPASSLEQAAHFYVVNRCSFSGSTFSGGMSPNHPRFTHSSIANLHNFRCPDLSVECLDFHATLHRHTRSLLYLDPPYLIQGGLYGKNGNTHKDCDHDGLRELLRQRDRWILSYNDSREIRQMYAGYRFHTPQWKYGMPHNKNSQELEAVS